MVGKAKFLRVVALGLSLVMALVVLGPEAKADAEAQSVQKRHKGKGTKVEAKTPKAKAAKAKAAKVQTAGLPELNLPPLHLPNVQQPIYVTNAENLFADPAPVAEDAKQKELEQTPDSPKLSEVSATQAQSPAPVTPPAAPARSVGMLSSETPDSFRGMVESYRQGNTQGAAFHADQFVTELVNLMFEVRVYTQLIGEAMIRQGVIDEEDWVGVGQYLSRELAKAGEENGSLLKTTHEQALKRITPDAKGEAEIYFFFTLDCNWCREMAPDVERLWRVVEKDKKLKMVALSPQPYLVEWVESFREYTGLTLPIYNGKDFTKAFKIGYVPALVVVAPNSKTSYIKTGKQDFVRLYEFVRAVQGKSRELPPDLKELIATPIGQVEVARSKGQSVIWEDHRDGGSPLPFGVVPVSNHGPVRDTLEEF